ncbi:hypothetical protein EDD37DRAFT_248009 [Exophiala viscosa]|uniref:uncharacterized protein n=1 Tax=Exophiala viscosa TaxID=2486360 RepID=UPI00219DFFE4|nr:hypothetical protein EDD37DRAFT_248009 [Exophiala viscosa]
MAPATRKKGASTRPNIMTSLFSSPASSSPVPKTKTSTKSKTNEPDLVSDHDSDHSDYGNAKKKNKKRKNMGDEDDYPFKRRRGPISPAPELPVISDDEGIRDVEPLDEEQHITDPFSTPYQLPKNLMLQVTADGKTFVGVDLASLLKSNSTLLPGVTEAYTPKSIESGRIVQDDSLMDVDQALNKKDKTGFLDLPYELRLRIYRLVFRGASAVDFCARRDFSKSAHFLRTSKQVHREGTRILYGENSFHFGRSHEKRGVYWQQAWKEIGYKDVRRFLETIGPVNIASLKYVSFMCEDGNKYNFPLWSDVAGRQYVEDASLQRVFRLIGENAMLTKLAVCFGAKTNVKEGDYHFLHALTRMKCHQLIIYSGFREIRNRMFKTLKSKLKQVMEVPVDEDNERSPGEIKQNKVKMAYEDDMAPTFGYSRVTIV